MANSGGGAGEGKTMSYAFEDMGAGAGVGWRLDMTSIQTLEASVKLWHLWGRKKLRNGKDIWAAIQHELHAI